MQGADTAKKGRGGTQLSSTTMKGSTDILDIDTFAELVSNSDLDQLAKGIMVSLGGIDQILNEYIRITRKYEDEELVTAEQRQRISDLINLRSESPGNMTSTLETETRSQALARALDSTVEDTFWDRIYERAKLKNNTFHLNHSDTLLHRILGNEHITRCFIHFLLSKITIGILFIVIGFPLSFTIVFYPEYLKATWFAVLGFTLEFVYSIYCIVLSLSCNIPMMMLIFLGFDFWVKLGYAVTAAIARSLHIRLLDYSSNEIMFWDMFSVVFIFVIIAGSLVEGYAVSFKMSFGVALVMSIISSFFAVQYTLFPGEEEKAIELWSGASFGLLSWIGSAYRVMSLFLWKQTIMAAYTRRMVYLCLYIALYQME